MAFQNESGNNKQRLNLSSLAEQIVLEDMFTFGETKRSTFINRIFENYYPKAEASVSRILNQLDGKLSELLSDLSNDQLTKKRLIQKLHNQRLEELEKKVGSYPKGGSWPIALNKKNFEYLTAPNSECREEKYYKKITGYLKALIEEYARLPYVEREKIYFLPYFTVIYEAIENKYRLKVVTDQDMIFSVYPYQIMCDPLSTIHYLVGYSTRYDEPETDKCPCSFKIAALKAIQAEKSKSGFLSNSMKQQLSKTITSRGVQFMIGSETEIHVRLTEAGVHKYHRLVHLRPTKTQEPVGDIYTFQCTMGQAEFYFFKFGKDAEILFPEELRKKFGNMYQQAASIYQEQEEVPIDPVDTTEKVN